ncbi:trypsin-like peptidase domain-containing protein [Pelagibacteraceae bacterium]|nr:trypsin-like peptidase domain-containing protein [Pelagibacteraceae bacterium]
MTKILLIAIFILNFSLPLIASNFETNLDKIKSDINSDQINEALTKLGKIEIINNDEQEKIDLIFGDIYLKINKPQKAIEFYEKAFMTSNVNIESLSELGISEASLKQGKLEEAIKHAKRSLDLNDDSLKTKIILAIAQTRNGDGEIALKNLENLYQGNKNDSEVNLAIAGYYTVFEDTDQAIKILEQFNKSHPENIKVLNELANLYWFDGNKKKALEYKFIVFKYYEFNRNRLKLRQTKQWILSIDPKYFDKPVKIKTQRKKNNKSYQKNEIKKYEKRKKQTQYEKFNFAYNFTGSGFVVGKGNYVITNNHVIKGATKIAVRNGEGKISNAKVAALSKKYDLAILELEKSYDKFLKPSDFADPVAGQDVISIGYPMSGYFGNDLPVITQGIVSKVFNDEIGLFITTTDINAGNSGGPILDLKGRLVGVSVATINKKQVMEKTGNIPTSMGIAIKSNMIKEVFTYKKTIPIRNIKFNKSEIYEDMIPKIVFIAVKAEAKKKK